MASKGEVWHSTAGKVAAFYCYANSFFMVRPLAFLNALQ